MDLQKSPDSNHNIEHRVSITSDDTEHLGKIDVRTKRLPLNMSMIALLLEKKDMNVFPRYVRTA